MIRKFTNVIEWELLKKDFYKEMNKSCRKDLLINKKSEHNDIIYHYIDSIICTLKKFLNVKHIILTENGTQALMISLKSLGIGNGDEVITTPYSFIASANAIRLVGATPVFVDIKKDTWNIDENKIEEKITNKTKAILSVDWFGNPCNYDKILEIAKKHNLKVVDDACQAFTSEYNGRKIGSIADITCFSFSNDKSFGNFGRGGAIVTNNNSLASILNAMADHGTNNNNEYVMVGDNGFWEYMEYIYFYVKLKYICNNLAFRNNIANIYKQMKNVTWQKQELNAISSWCRFQVIFLNKESEEIAKRFFELDYLYLKDIPNNSYYNSYRKDTLISKNISEKCIGLPIYPFIDSNLVQSSVNKYNEAIMEGKI